MLTLFYSQENIFFLIEKIQVKEIDPKNLGEAILTKAFAVSFPRGSSRPRDRTPVSCIAGRFFNHWATREASTVLITDYQNSNSNFTSLQNTVMESLPEKFQMKQAT